MRVNLIKVGHEQMEEMHVNISGPKIKETAIKGINRAAVFMGLGINAASDERLKEYLLTSESNLQLLPVRVDDNVLMNWKREFSIWIVACGFREMIERFCVFLDRIQQASLLIRGKYDHVEANKFEHFGLRKKVAKLSEGFGITCKYPQALCTIYDARNCLVHRMGRVSTRDLNESGKLSIKWVSPSFYFVSLDGTEAIMPDLMDPSTLPWQPPTSGKIATRFDIKKIEFVEDEWVKIRPKELQEILLFMRCCTEDYISSFQEMAKNSGVPFLEIVDKPQSE